MLQCHSSAIETELTLTHDIYLTYIFWFSSLCNCRLKHVTKYLLRSWRHYSTGHITYKKILAAVSQQKVFWQILVRVILWFSLAEYVPLEAPVSEERT